MINNAPFSDPMAWLLGLLGTVTLGWVGTTSKKVSDHSIKIAVLETNYTNIKESLDRIEDHIGSRPKE